MARWKPFGASASRLLTARFFCLLGPNGAGKTTTVEILEGYRRRSDGEVRVLGMDPADGPIRQPGDFDGHPAG